MVLQLSEKSILIQFKINKNECKTRFRHRTHYSGYYCFNLYRI
ncbi:hypothetical protein BN1088_1500147 [Sphingobacterium sp. PM2-P1-29]|nr:hypothetical protein BN1088_1500147 [Sphingobacterium sp. PM2-P1-29]